ncbi:hypothetical protein Tco_0689683 [Tanacetum coccineum]
MFGGHWGDTTLPNSEIFEQLALMGYETDFDKLTFQKGNYLPQWRFFIHKILHCFSLKKTSWEQFSSNIATAIICLATTRTFNFSKFIFDAMVKKLEQTVKTSQSRRRTRVVLSNEEEISKDPSNQGRSLIEELDLDVKISLVPPHDAEIQEKISDDTKVLLEEEKTTELVEEPTKLVEVQGSVHHVSTEKRTRSIMLVEKDYPLTKGLVTLMLCNKLRVDQHSEMADELLIKIYNIANRPRNNALRIFNYYVWLKDTRKESGGVYIFGILKPRLIDNQAVMSSASSAVTYTFVYTDSEPGRREPQTPPVLQDEDEREPMLIQSHDPDYMPEPMYPEYIPLEDDHVLLAEEQPLPPTGFTKSITNIPYAITFMIYILFPSTTEHVISGQPSEPVFESPNHSQTSQTTQSQQLQQYHTTIVTTLNAKFPYLQNERKNMRRGHEMEYWIMNSGSQQNLTTLLFKEETKSKNNNGFSLFQGDHKCLISPSDMQGISGWRSKPDYGRSYKIGTMKEKMWKCCCSSTWEDCQSRDDAAGRTINW